MANVGLFDHSEKQVRTGMGHEIKWRLVTNHLNMMFMLSAGLVMPPGGFGKKYYQDTLSLLPGWVPLFPEHIFRSAIEYSVAEQALLRPCYAEMDLSTVSGPVKVLRSGRWEDASFPDEVYGDEDLLLVPAPLPVTMIREIGFSSKEDKSYCEKDAKSFFNVPLSDFKTKSTSASFKKAKEGLWPPLLGELEGRQASLTLPDALGGVVATLGRLSNRDDAAIATYKAFFQERLDDNALAAFPMLLGAHAIFHPADEVDESPSRSSSALFRRLAEALVRAREEGDSGSANDTIMEVLEESNTNLQGQAKEASDRLMGDLRRSVQFPDKTLDELLEVHQKPLPQALILFFLNDDALDLLDINAPLPDGQALCGAAILFGIADGWMRTPDLLRESNGLNRKVPDFMANLSHRVSGTGLHLGPLPERPRSLREMLSDTQWNKKMNDAALYMARACKWDCIRTRIRLGKGEYALHIDGSGASLMLEGDVKAVESEVDHETFLTQLGQATAIPTKVERDVRAILGS